MLILVNGFYSFTASYSFYPQVEISLYFINPAGAKYFKTSSFQNVTNYIGHIIISGHSSLYMLAIASAYNVFPNPI